MMWITHSILNSLLAIYINMMNFKFMSNKLYRINNIIIVLTFKDSPISLSGSRADFHK